jgi:hypothetical protein
MMAEHLSHCRKFGRGIVLDHDLLRTIAKSREQSRLNENDRRGAALRSSKIGRADEMRASGARIFDTRGDG